MFFGSGSVTLRFSAVFAVSQPDLLPCPPAAQASWVLCERGWGEQGGRVELRQGVIEERWFPLRVSIIPTLLELFMNVHIINYCHDDWLR